ncbi:hypothetical protein PPERSA_10632 [Pseudocohnilembus persalinus]|uniref:Calmodulin n=1 Tax=Pseudocohnilembus persalinus TaxID=266149 RepID=A0A0V0QDH2_PSEPJ|nr:hypothetical protein PPERSA_10632 [Pseudocohnilembus persalinus]|eukprot:KRX00133.1 hypothetical protein PPERSA_10632 [Pseudocohnilembus persalinus]
MFNQQKAKKQIILSEVIPEEVLNQDEMRACKESFDAYDKLGYGTIEAEELQKVLEELGQKPTRQQIYKMIDEVDEHKKGYLEYKDFIRAIAYHKLIENEKEEMDTLEAYVSLGGDASKEGEIGTEQLVKIIKDEFNMTIDIERLINEIDTDKSGKISYMEFKTLLSD